MHLMDLLGIATGSFDFAVTRQGEHVFFEVNEQGQFLWMEDRYPGLPVLQVFSEFLLSGDKHFEWKGEIDPGRSLASFAKTGLFARAKLLEALNSANYIRPGAVDEVNQSVR